MKDILSKTWEEEVEEESWFKDWWEIAEMELEKEKEENGRWEVREEKG